MLDDLMGRISCFLSKPILAEDDEIDGVEEVQLESTLRAEYQRDMDVEVEDLPYLEEEMTPSQFARACAYEQKQEITESEDEKEEARETLMDIAEELLEDEIYGRGEIK